MAEEHVRGRMPLESNPGNRNPAIPPVFDTTGKEDYRRVSPENPLPTKDKDLDERLTAIKNKLDSVIENGALNTQLTGSNVALKISEMEETVSSNRVGNLPAGSSEIVVDIEQPCILESLMLGTDRNNIVVRVQNRKHDGSYETGMRLVSVRGDYSVPVMPEQLNTIGGENDYWREFVYNPDLNEFALGMKRTTSFGNGVRITIENSNEEDQNVALTYLITILHKNGGQ